MATVRTEVPKLQMLKPFERTWSVNVRVTEDTILGSAPPQRTGCSNHKSTFLSLVTPGSCSTVALIVESPTLNQRQTLRGLRCKCCILVLRGPSPLQTVSYPLSVEQHWCIRDCFHLHYQLSVGMWSSLDSIIKGVCYEEKWQSFCSVGV
jgi:hypothetical protein